MLLDNDQDSTQLTSRSASRVSSEILDHARRVGLRLLPALVGQPSYVLGVTSALPGEGKTTIGLALAEVLATDFGHQVIVVDAHAERPWSHKDQVSSQQGSVDWLRGASTLDDVVVRGDETCDMLPLGSRPLSSRGLLQALIKHDAFGQLRKRYSVIVVDLPNLANPSGPALANVCDGIIVVVRAGQTPADAVQEFLPILEKVTIHGVVLNRHRSAVPTFLQRLFA